MQEIKNIIKNMSNIEKMITIIAVIALIGIQFTTDSSLMAFITAILGIGYVLCVKYRSKYAMVLGVIQCALYAMIAFNNKVYGDVFLNTYNVCFLAYGFINWKNNSTEGKVNVRMLDKKGVMILGLFTIITYSIMFMLLSKFNGYTPYLDAFNTTFSCIATYLCCMRYRVQWVYWNCVNISSVILYTSLWASGSNVLPLVLMFTLYLLNSLHAAYIWYKNK